MNLVQAWNTLAPLMGEGWPPEQHEAVVVLYEALIRVSASIRIRGQAEDLAKDECAEALMAVTKGVRETYAEDDPAAEGHIRKYLHKALERRVLRVLRLKKNAMLTLASGDEKAAIDMKLENAPAQAWLAEPDVYFDLIERFHEKVVRPHVATRRSDRQMALVKELEEMVLLAMGAVTLDDLVHASEVSPDALYKRHQRTRDDLVGYLNAERGQSVSEEDAKEFHWLLERLCRGKQRRAGRERSEG